MTAYAADVDVRVAEDAERPLLEGLLQFYVYDFSELEPADSGEFEVGPDGLFGVEGLLEGYWREPSHTAFLIRRGGRLAGFALVNAISDSGLPVDRNMAQFFVMRKHRRAGVAMTAVNHILTRLPGVWEIAVAERNTGARAFWPTAIEATPGVRDLITLQGDKVRWTGPIHRFTVAP